MYYALYELKLNTKKDKIFSERDVQFILNTLKIRKQRLKSNLQLRQSNFNGYKDVRLRRPSNNCDENDNIQYCNYIKKKILRMLETGKKISLKVISRLFKILNEKDELFPLF